MKVSGSHIEKIESMSQTVFRIKEEQTIQVTTEKLAKEGKHIINIVRGTPSSFMGSVTQTITFLWEADTEDATYENFLKNEEYKKKLDIEIMAYKQLIQENRSRIHAAELIEAAPASALQKNEKKIKTEKIVYPILGIVCSMIFFLCTIAFEGFFAFLFGCFGVISLIAAIYNIYEALEKYIKPEEYKKQQELHLKNEEAKIKKVLSDKDNLNVLKDELRQYEEKLSSLEREYKTHNL